MQTPDLKPWLDLTPAEAQRQWRQVIARPVLVEGKRQEKFLPVEVLLCYALFQVINPHSYGKANKNSIPPIVQTLAGFCKRPPLSLTSKMLNLEGTRPNGGRLEPELFLRLHQDFQLFAPLYRIVVDAAWAVGLPIPDVLAEQGGFHELIGQDELGSYELGMLVDEAHEEQQGQETYLSQPETEQITITRARLGQHRFAVRVLRSYDNRCGFCGWQPAGLSRMLVASHIKPWRDSTPRERWDPRNGIAACPIHDVAFDTGLVTVNGGLRIHRSTALTNIVADPGYFRAPVLHPTLMLPEKEPGPDPRYLKWHQEHIYQR